MTTLAVITPTCRNEPRFGEMAKTIGANAEGGHFERVVWYVVDDRLWGPDAAARAQKLIDARPQTFSPRIVHTPPKPSLWRGPFRTSAEDLPDVNGARNTGLELAKENYIFFLDDCSIITQSTFACLAEAAKQGSCLRVPWSKRQGISVPSDGKISLNENAEISFTPCLPSTIAGGCFGAPKQAYIDINGFDEIYGGCRGYNDLDAAVRMERAGYKLLTTRRCASIQMNSTHTKTEVSKNPEAHTGKASRKHWDALLQDRSRIFPVQPATPEPAEFLAEGTPVEPREAIP